MNQQMVDLGLRKMLLHMLCRPTEADICAVALLQSTPNYSFHGHNSRNAANSDCKEDAAFKKTII